MASSFQKAPFVSAGADTSGCFVGWPEIAANLRGHVAGRLRCVLCVECYPGVFVAEIEEALSGLNAALTLRTEELFLPAAELDRRLHAYLTDDPVFGRMNDLEMEAFFGPAKLGDAQRKIAARHDGLIVVIGPGAALVAPGFDTLVYANLARWPIQLRQRRHEIGNLGADNATEHPGWKYKRAFFIDWRAADRLKRRLYDRIDFLLDTNDKRKPKMITGRSFRDALTRCVHRPFELVPFFDPGPWGGSWMMKKFDLPEDQPNYAWCFTCVPEENSLLLGFGSERVQIPAIDLVFRHPRELLGDDVYARFGAEFPIRFDFLDTMNGGNLSLQVHPLTEYIRENFGLAYTQDESYYMLDAGPGAVVYLGLKEGVDRSRMAADLSRAQQNGSAFPAAQYVNVWPARKHDHFLIPAGTIHCSGRNSLVLEISATPYIFTFKLWDWGRLGLDGRPRPIHLDHGLANIQWNRSTAWVGAQLVNRIAPCASGCAWREESTGLHELEFIETRRHWFTGPVSHHTRGTVNVLNLVEGERAVVESPENAFEPLVVNYAETFIVPAAVGPYTIRPVSHSARELATVKAFVRRENAV